MPSFFASYVGMPAAAVLDAPALRSWTFERSTDTYKGGLLVTYKCSRHDFEMSCGADELIRTIFLKNSPAVQSLLEISFSGNRDSALEAFGAPSKSGAPYKSPYLGAFGGWDLFPRETYVIHVEYEPDVDRIRMVTLMRRDVVP